MATYSSPQAKSKSPSRRYSQTLLESQHSLTRNGRSEFDLDSKQFDKLGADVIKEEPTWHKRDTRLRRDTGTVPRKESSHQRQPQESFGEEHVPAPSARRSTRGVQTQDCIPRKSRASQRDSSPDSANDTKVLSQGVWRKVTPADAEKIRREDKDEERRRRQSEWDGNEREQRFTYVESHASRSEANHDRNRLHSQVQDQPPRTCEDYQKQYKDYHNQMYDYLERHNEKTGSSRNTISASKDHSHVSIPTDSRKNQQSRATKDEYLSRKSTDSRVSNAPPRTSICSSSRDECCGRTSMDRTANHSPISLSRDSSSPESYRATKDEYLSRKSTDSRVSNAPPRTSICSSSRDECRDGSSPESYRATKDEYLSRKSTDSRVSNASPRTSMCSRSRDESCGRKSMDRKVNHSPIRSLSRDGSSPESYRATQDEYYGRRSKDSKLVPPPRSSVRHDDNYHPTQDPYYARKSTGGQVNSFPQRSSIRNGSRPDNYRASNDGYNKQPIREGEDEYYGRKSTDRRVSDCSPHSLPRDGVSYRAAEDEYCSRRSVRAEVDRDYFREESNIGSHRGTKVCSRHKDDPVSDVSDGTEVFAENGWRKITDSERTAIRRKLASLSERSPEPEYEVGEFSRHQSTKSVGPPTVNIRNDVASCNRLYGEPSIEECSEATEVLTEQGWKKVRDVRKGDDDGDSTISQPLSTFSEEMNKKSQRGSRRASMLDDKRRDSSSKHDDQGSYCPSEMSTEILIDNQWVKMNDQDRARIRAAKELHEPAEVAVSKSEAGESEIYDCNIAPRRSSVAVSKSEAGESEIYDCNIAPRRSSTFRDGHGCGDPEYCRKNILNDSQVEARREKSLTSYANERHSGHVAPTSLELNLNEPDHLAVAQGIVWQFDNSGAKVRRFNPEVEGNALISKVRIGHRLKMINEINVQGLNKWQIMDLWCKAQEWDDRILKIEFEDDNDDDESLNKGKERGSSKCAGPWSMTE